MTTALKNSLRTFISVALAGVPAGMVHAETQSLSPIDSVKIQSPPDGSAWNVVAFPQVQGLVFTSHTPQRVRLFLQRFDGEYWDGHSWSATLASVEMDIATGRTPGTTRFSLTSLLPTQSDLLQNRYWLWIQAYDAMGNPLIKTPALIQVVIDRTSPVSLITWPMPPAEEGWEGHYTPEASYPSSANTFPAITGEARDELSGIDRIHIYIRRLGDDQWWTGQKWSGDQRAACTVGTKEWDCSKSLPSGPDLRSGEYRVEAHAYDKAGNTGTTYLNVSVRHPDA